MNRLKKPLKLSKTELLREAARRKGIVAAPGTFRLEDYLFDKQLAFVRDASPFKVAVTTRRAGKSVSCVTDLLHTATSTPSLGSAMDPISLYITLSRKNAKRLVWPLFKKLNSVFTLNGEVNESDLSLKFPNGHMIYLLGAADQAAIEDFRGLPVIKAYVDEAQSFPTYLEPMLNDSLGPTLADYNGQLILIGTPGPVPAGYFHEIAHNPEWSKHYWSFFDNPKLPFLQQGLTHQDMLLRELRRRGVKLDDPSIQREWFGKWVSDKDSLVYHWSQDNHYDQLPPGQWNYLIGLDLGFKDADAIAVLAWSETDPATYLVEEQITRGQDISALTAQIDSMCKKYPVDKIVVDAGGLGKKITEEISRRFATPMVAAEKTRKMEYIELMNDALRTRKLYIKSGSRFAHDAMKVEWDHDKSTPERKVVSDRFHSDICDAVLYAWRESYSYTYKASKAEPEFGTREWSDSQSEMMFNAELERLEQAKAVEEAFKEQQTPELDMDQYQRLDRPRLRYQDRFDKKRKI